MNDMARRLTGLLFATLFAALLITLGDLSGLATSDTDNDPSLQPVMAETSLPAGGALTVAGLRKTPGKKRGVSK